MDFIFTGRLKRWGGSRDELTKDLLSGKMMYPSASNYPALTWADMSAVGWLVDGAAVMNQVPLQRTSYGPYFSEMIQICKEESFHQRQGFDIMMMMAKGLACLAQDGAGCAEPYMVSGADDVRAIGRGDRALCPINGMKNQNQYK